MDKIDLGGKVAEMVAAEVLDLMQRELLKRCWGCKSSVGGEPCRIYKRESVVMATQFISSIARGN
jgi:hypothetical protein